MISLVLILILFVSLCCSSPIIVINANEWKKKDRHTSRHLKVVRSRRPEIAECETGLQEQREQNKRINELPRRDHQQQQQKRSLATRVAPIQSDSDAVDSDFVEEPQSDVANLKGQVRRSKQQNQELNDRIIKKETIRVMPQSSLPLSKQLQTQVQQVQRNQESQMRLIQSNVQRAIPDFQQPSSSGAIPSAPI